MGWMEPVQEMKGPRDVPVFALLSRVISLLVEQHVFAGPRVGISMQFPRKPRIHNWVFNPYAVFQLAADSLWLPEMTVWSCRP